MKVESLMKDQALAGSPKSPFPSVSGSTGSLLGALSPASPICGHCNSHHFQQGRIRFLSGHGHSGVTDSITPAQVSGSGCIIGLFKCLLS